jgi:hypothetical protein
MTASLLQLVAIGNEDYMINGNPQISFFKSVHLKYVNFSIERLESLPKTKGKFSLTNVSETIFEINTDNMDALGNTYLSITLPDIKAKFPYKFEWIDNIGDFILEKADFIINGVSIESIDSNIIHMHSKNIQNHDNKNNIDKIKSMKSTYLTPNYTFNDNNKFSKEPNMKSIDKINLNYNTIPSISSKKIYIKLPFFFSKNEVKLPLVSLKKSIIQIRLYLRPLNELFRISSPKKVTVRNNSQLLFDHTNKDTYDEYLYNVYDTVYSNDSPDFKLNNFVDNINFIYNNTNTSMISYIYFFDKQDVDFFKNKTEFLINTTSIFKNKTKTINNELIIKSPSLIKEIIIVPYRNDIKLRNNYNYYGIHDNKLKPESVKKWYNYYFELSYNQYISDLRYISTINNINKSKIDKVFNTMEDIDKPYYVIFNYYDNKGKHRCIRYTQNELNIEKLYKYCSSYSDEYHSSFLYYGMFQNQTFDVVVLRPFFFRYKLLNLNHSGETIKSLMYLPTIYTSSNTIYLYFNEPTYTTSILKESIRIEKKYNITKTDILAILNNWNYRHFKKIPIITDNNYNYFNNDECIESIDITYKGNSIINKLDRKNIYNTIQFNHYRHNNNIDNIVKIPFSLKPNQYSPSGHLNMQELDKLDIYVKIKDIFISDPLLDDSSINLDVYLSVINKIVIADDKIKMLI